MNLNINIIDWLAENNNPAIEYRTKTELLNEKADNSKVIDWVKNILPFDWKDTKGLWLTYYYNAIAECGISGLDFGIKKSDVIKYFQENPFEYNCQNFMQLRAFVMLGFEKELQNIGIIENLYNKQLLDGGFLCLHRLVKYEITPKSCVKCNNFALLFLSECKKRNINTSIENNLLQYYWKHKLFYKSTNLSSLILNAREGWRTIDTFYPFEVMRIGIQNIVEAFCTLGYGKDKKLEEAWNILEGKKDKDGKYKLNGTLSKSYLPKEKVGKPSKWVTFYAILARKNKKK
ncbi:MAG: hypothetical protein LBC88_06485 [Spirochaetaceae bacterium]|jgi:hypothetical protein|nr:hypothetical protein [Spirochaetaceae bacterium]